MPTINFAKMYDPEAVKSSPERTKQQIALAQSLLGADTGAIYSPVAGAAKVAEKAFGGWLARSAMDEEKQADQAASDLLSRALMGWGSNSSAATSSVPASSSPMPGAEVAPSDAPPTTGSRYRDAIASIESAGSGNYSAIGPTHPTMGRALGRYQVMESNIGPWSKEALGREVTPDEFMANPQIQDAIFDHQFAKNLHRYGNPQDAASVWFTGRPMAQGANARDSLGTTGSQYVGKFNRALGQPPARVASADPSIGVPGGTPMPADVPTLPAQAGVMPLLAQGAPAPMSGAQPMPQSAPMPQPQAQAPQPAPVKMAQANPLATALQAPPSIPQGIAPEKQALIQELLRNPRTRQAGLMLFQQEQEQARAAAKLAEERYWKNQELALKRQELNRPMAVGPEQDVIGLDGRVIRQGERRPITVAPGNTLMSPSGEVIGRAPQNPDIRDVNGRVIVTDPASGTSKDTTPQGMPRLDPTKAPAELRKEIMDLPSYKNYKQAAPIYKSMSEAAGRNTRAADLNLVYGLGKMFDPGSVVREGEMVMVKNTASLPDWLQGMINTLNGGAQLTPELRRRIMEEAHGRMQAYESEFATDTDFYRGIATRGGLAVEDIVPGFSPSSPWQPAPSAEGAAQPGQGGKPITPELKAEFDAAVAGGKPRQILIQRLIQNGYDASGL